MLNPGEKILLGLLPFWTPLVPPLGISCLKSSLLPHGYRVKTFDANVEGRFRDVYNRYFDLLADHVPHDRRGNFFNLGHDVLENHMMAHLHHGNDKKQYRALVKTLAARNYAVALDDRQVDSLTQVVEEFFLLLEEYILALLAEERPDVLGLSVFRGTLAASVCAFRTAKREYPHIKTVMGGAVFSQGLCPGLADMDAFMQTVPEVDKFIVGEGENLFLQYLRGALPDTQRIYSLEDIGQELLDLSAAVPVDFSDFDLQYYPYIAAYTSRSCPFQCSFCAETVYWGKYRKKGAGQVFAEMAGLYETHGGQLFLLCDSLLNPVISDLAQRFLESDLSLYWDGYLRVDRSVCQPENALLWRRGGFYRARLGVESGSAHVLELMGKKIGPTQIKEAVANLAAAGIKTTTYWVIGHPGETEEDFQQTLALLEELRDDIYEAEANPFRFFPAGQVNSAPWVERSKIIPLYGQEAKESLIVQTWVLEEEPTWEETLQRLGRFAKQCERLGIPNPYSMYEIQLADERWKKLQKNSVPALAEFKVGKSAIRENRDVQALAHAENKLQLDGDWGF